MASDILLEGDQVIVEGQLHAEGAHLKDALLFSDTTALGLQVKGNLKVTRTHFDNGRPGPQVSFFSVGGVPRPGGGVITAKVGDQDFDAPTELKVCSAGPAHLNVSAANAKLTVGNVKHAQVIILHGRISAIDIQLGDIDSLVAKIQDLEARIAVLEGSRE